MKRKQHILRAWILLLCFIAGQYVVYAHQHRTRDTITTNAKLPKATLKEKCDLCDAMHHTYMDICMQINLPAPVSVKYTYNDDTYTFTSIGVILSKGRSPPLS